jgi:hypothetical protein
LGAFFCPQPGKKTGLSATSPRICSCKSCGLSATIPCASGSSEQGHGIAAGNSITPGCRPTGFSSFWKGSFFDFSGFAVIDLFAIIYLV